MARREQHQFLLWVVLLLLASFAFASNASAADLHDPSGSFTGLLDLVKNSAAQWDGKLRGYAKTLFWLLASIQFVWTFMPLVFRQADFGEIVGELIRFILVIGFFYALLLFSAEWADKVVDSFRTAGASAAGLGTSQIRPGDIFGTSIELANTIGDVETWNPLTATMVALAGLLVLLCFAFIAAFMGLTIIESYVVINASVLFMGFGASQWTREYALAIVRYAVSVGAKLFVLTLIVGLIVDSAKTWQAAYNHDDASMWTMVGLALVCAYLAKTIPELVAGMISGTSMGGGSAIGGMAAAGAAGAAAAIATIATAGAAAPAAAGALARQVWRCSRCRCSGCRWSWWWRSGCCDQFQLCRWQCARSGRYWRRRGSFRPRCKHWRPSGGQGRVVSRCPSGRQRRATIAGASAAAA